MSEETANAIDAQQVVTIAKPYRLQFENAQACWVLLYPEGMVKLNGPAGEILSRCDGEKAIATVIEELETAFDQSNLQQDVLGFLEIARENRWVLIRPI